MRSSRWVVNYFINEDGYRNIMTTLDEDLIKHVFDYMKELKKENCNWRIVFSAGAICHVAKWNCNFCENEKVTFTNDDVTRNNGISIFHVGNGFIKIVDNREGKNPEILGHVTNVAIVKER